MVNFIKESTDKGLKVRTRHMINAIEHNIWDATTNIIDYMDMENILWDTTRNATRWATSVVLWHNQSNFLSTKQDYE